jgi:PAS domain S-box-containing protein
VSLPVSQQLLSFIEQAPIAIALFDRNMRYLATSQCWKAGHGLGGASLAGLSHYDVFPQVPQRWREVHTRVLAGEEVACEADPLPRTDGGTDWVRWSMKPWRYPSGEIGGALLFKEVITAQIEARAKIARSEALFRETFENAAVGIAHASPGGAWLFVNPQLCKITGYSAEELLTKTVRDITHPADFEGYLPKIKSMYRGEIDSFSAEKRYLRKDGSIVWVRLRISCARKSGGPIDHFIAVIVDISAQKMAEIALRESEERFRGIFEYAGTGIAIGDLEGRFHSGNPALCSMLGYTKEELGELAIRDVAHPADFEECMFNFQRLVAQEISSFETLNRYVSKDGKPIWVHKHVSLLRDSGGRPVNALALVTNVTERKRHEDQVSLLLQEVNHRAKNMLTVVQAIARQTAEATPGDFIRRFGERIQGLAASQNLLIKSEWKGVDLHELALSQLEHFKDLVDKRIKLRGPPLLLAASAAQVVGMALHELGTNAGKYGALSNDTGRVELHWDVEPAKGGGETFVMTWRERDGPVVEMPSRLGFGSTVLSRVVNDSFNAEIGLNYKSTGLVWRLQCATKEIIDDSCSA